MTRWMIDASTPPVPSEVVAFVQQQGWKVEEGIIAGYIGGATPRVWTPEEFGAYQSAGIPGIVTIYVPAQSRAHYTAADGLTDAMTVVQLREGPYASVPSDAVAVVDIEADMASAPGMSAYLQAFVPTLQSHGIPAGVYAPLGAFWGWPAVPALAWLSGTPYAAGSLTPLADAVTQVPSQALSLAHWVGWQYAVSVNLPSSQIDVSVIVDGTAAYPSVLEPQPSTVTPSPTVSMFTQGQKAAAQDIINYIQKKYLVN